MTSSILACIDDSVYLKSVCQCAAWAASRLRTGVEVLHAIDAHRESAKVADFSGAIGVNASLELTEQLAKLEEERGRVAQLKGRALLAVAGNLLAEAGIARVKSTLRHGGLVDTIVEFEDQAAWIVMGKQGEGADFASGHLGSNLERVIRSVHRPVLVAARGFREIRTLVMAYDSGSSAVKAVEHLAACPGIKDIRCHLVSVGRENGKHAQTLPAAVAKLQEAGFAVTSSVVEGTAEHAIPAEATRVGADLLVMGAFGHSQFKQFFVGSTTASVLRSILVPVLLFR